MSFNRVILMGNLTRDPELRTVGTGSTVCDLGIALNRKYKTQNGEMKEETTFVDVAVWARQGENVKRYLSKGDPVLIEGRLKFDSWQAQDGTRRSKLSVVAENVRFLPRGGRGGGDGGGYVDNGQQADPFADQRSDQQAAPFADQRSDQQDAPFADQRSDQQDAPFADQRSDQQAVPASNAAPFGDSPIPEDDVPF